MGGYHILKVRNYDLIYWQKILKMTIFQSKMVEKLPLMAKISFFYIDPTLAGLMSVHLMGMHLSYKKIGDF